MSDNPIPRYAYVTSYAAFDGDDNPAYGIIRIEEFVFRAALTAPYLKAPHYQHLHIHLWVVPIADENYLVTVTRNAKAFIQYANRLNLTIADGTKWRFHPTDNEPIVGQQQ